MSYISLEKILEKLRKSSIDENEEKEIMAIEILIDTIQGKFKKIIGAELSLFTPMASVMGSEMEIVKSQLSKSETTRLLICYDFYKRHERYPDLRQIATYKSDDPSKDDIANEGRIMYRLEKKEMIDVKREPSKEDLFQINEIGRNYLNTFVFGTKSLVDIYKRSRNDKIRQFLLEYLDN